MKIKINKKKGIFFRISGLPGSGKTELAKKLLPQIRNEFGPTIMWSGDDLRRIFKNKKYDLQSRYEFGKINVKLAKFFNDQMINVIFATVGLNDKIRKYTKLKIKNYIEILVKTDLKKIKKLNLRKFYTDGSANVWGLDLKPEYPKRPSISIKNNFKVDLNKLSLNILNQLKKKYIK